MHAATALLPLTAGALGAMLASCGPSASTPSPTPTPLPSSLLQQRYAAAANAYNVAEMPIAQNENTYCVQSAPSADLNKCGTALSADRQTTIAFDTAVRAIMFPNKAQTDVRQLLGDDAQLETLLEQAAAAPSLASVSTLTTQIFKLLTTTTSDAARVRADIGLPPPSPTASSQ